MWGSFVFSLIGSIIASYLINSSLKEKIAISSEGGLATLNPFSSGWLPLIFFGIFMGIIIFIYLVWSLLDDE